MNCNEGWPAADIFAENEYKKELLELSRASIKINKTEKKDSKLSNWSVN